MTETKNNLMNAALHYASHGFYVLPIKPNAKNPAIKFKDQPALTADQIKSWWTKNPQDNIALRMVGKTSEVTQRLNRFALGSLLLKINE